MSSDSPLWASEGWVIPEVASFKEEGLVTKEGWDWEKGKLKNCCSKGELNPGLLHELSMTFNRCWIPALPFSKFDGCICKPLCLPFLAELLQLSVTSKAMMVKSNFWKEITKFKAYLSIPSCCQEIWNPSIFNIIRWVAGSLGQTDDTSTKRLMF